MNMGVRMIIRADHALLLEPDTMMSVNFLESWSERMMRNTPSEAEGMQTLPFELTMVEAALQETRARSWKTDWNIAHESIDRSSVRYKWVSRRRRSTRCAS